jgi:hypothetical protein
MRLPICLTALQAAGRQRVSDLLFHSVLVMFCFSVVVCCCFGAFSEVRVCFTCGTSVAREQAVKMSGSEDVKIQ